MTILLSILLAAVMSVLLYGTKVTQITILWVLLKLLLLPIIMSVGFEFIRYAGKHDNVFVSICAAPGLWMQRITTKEPTDDIIEVGIAALKAVLDEEPETPESVTDPDQLRAEIPELREIVDAVENAEEADGADAQ